MRVFVFPIPACEYDMSVYHPVFAPATMSAPPW